MCNSIKKVLKDIPTKIAEITDLDLRAAKAALSWIRLSLVPGMSQLELKEFKNQLSECIREIDSRINKGGIV